MADFETFEKLIRKATDRPQRPLGSVIVEIRDCRFEGLLSEYSNAYSRPVPAGQQTSEADVSDRSANQSASEVGTACRSAPRRRLNSPGRITRCGFRRQHFRRVYARRVASTGESRPHTSSTRLASGGHAARATENCGRRAAEISQAARNARFCAYGTHVGGKAPTSPRIGP